MRNGISAGPLPALSLPFQDEIARACAQGPTFSPLVAYAIKVNETSSGTDPAVIQDGGDPTTLLLPDGTQAGLGIFQLTSSFPQDWRDPYANALYAVTTFMLPAEEYWANQGFQGATLVRFIAAEYNAGRAKVIDGHNLFGDVDHYTTNNYALRALVHYETLLSGKTPF
jgi:hypothetical protein